MVLVSVPAVLLPDNGRDAIVRNPSPSADVGEPTDDVTACAGCGWQPNVIKIHKVVVHSDEREALTPSGSTQ
jgi:hypothetical protein